MAKKRQMRGAPGAPLAAFSGKWSVGIALAGRGATVPPSFSLMPEKGYILDMDGVVYREDHLIDGAAELIGELREQAIPLLFLTNNSAPTPEDLVVKLRHLGIPNLTPRHFYTSAMNTADFLSTIHPQRTAYVLGEGGLLSALKEAGIPNDTLRPDYVIVGEGNPA